MKTIEERFTVSYSYPVVFCRDVFSRDCGVLEELLLRVWERAAAKAAAEKEEAAAFRSLLQAEAQRAFLDLLQRRPKMET